MLYLWRNESFLPCSLKLREEEKKSHNHLVHDLARRKFLMVEGAGESNSYDLKPNKKVSSWQKLAQEMGRDKSPE